MVTEKDIEWLRDEFESLQMAVDHEYGDHPLGTSAGNIALLNYICDEVLLLLNPTASSA